MLSLCYRGPTHFTPHSPGKLIMEVTLVQELGEGMVNEHSIEKKKKAHVKNKLLLSLKYRRVLSLAGTHQGNCTDVRDVEVPCTLQPRDRTTFFLLHQKYFLLSQSLSTKVRDGCVICTQTGKYFQYSIHNISKSDELLMTIYGFPDNSVCKVFYPLKSTSVTTNPQQIRVSITFIMIVYEVHILSVSLHVSFVQFGTVKSAVSLNAI